MEKIITLLRARVKGPISLQYKCKPNLHDLVYRVSIPYQLALYIFLLWDYTACINKVKIGTKWPRLLTTDREKVGVKLEYGLY